LSFEIFRRMFKQNKSLGTCLLFVSILASCKTTTTVVKSPLETGSKPDFSNYVAIGNSLTAGYADGGLYTDGQMNSYPNIIAQQLKPFGGGVFNQPLFPQGQENGSGHSEFNGFGTNNKPLIDTVKTNLAIVGIPLVPIPGAPDFLLSKYTSPINNWGIPGLRVDKIEFTGYGLPGANPYYNRVLTDLEIAGLVPYRDKVLKTNPTFFTSWLGNSDAIQYALNGGADSTNVPLTSQATFRDVYTRFINLLTAKASKGVLGTIPDVTITPFFNTITVVQLLTEAKALGVAGVYIQPGTGPVRLAGMKDLILLNAAVGRDSLGMKKGFSKNYPLGNYEVLDSLEVVKVQNAVTGYNQTITSIASAKGLALMDINVLFNQVRSPGFTAGGVPFSRVYITGNVFSLDGVHLTPKGYALVANAFIGAINTTYHTSIATVDVSKYRGVKTPSN